MGVVAASSGRRVLALVVVLAALAGAVVELLEHPDVATRLGQEARKTGQHYDIAAFVRKMERLYDLLHVSSRATRRAGILKADLGFLTE